MFIYCTLLDYRIVGSITTPLLRFTPLKIDKHTIDLIDFENLFYYPLLYNDINEFGIKVLNELGQEIKFYNTRPTFLLYLEEEMYDYPIYKSSQNYKSPPYIYDKKYGRGSLRKTYDFPIYKSGNMQQPKKSIVYPIHKQQDRGVCSMLKKVNQFVRKLIQKELVLDSR